MINSFVTYILLGLLFTFIVEGISNSKQIQKSLKKQIHLGPIERIICILCWPLLLITFLYNFFKSYLGL